MFGLDPTEILIIVVVALVLIGPKDLPRAMKTAARWVGAGRKMAREFQGHVDELVREAELEELREKVRKVTSQPLSSHLQSMVDPDRDIDQAFLALPEHQRPPATPAEPAPVPGATETLAPPELAKPVAPPASVPETGHSEAPAASHGG